MLEWESGFCADEVPGLLSGELTSSEAEVGGLAYFLSSSTKSPLLASP